MISWICQEDPLDSFQPELFADADLAGDKSSGRSTSGLHLSLSGLNSSFVLTDARIIQRAVSFSSAESELASGYLAVRKVGLPSIDLWAILLNNPNIVLAFREDNQAMIQVLTTGKNPTMRHLRRVQKLSLRAFLRTSLLW